MASASSLKTVQQLYIAYYQRPGDPSGMLFWAQLLDTGTPLATVQAAFGGAPESTALYGPINSTTIGGVIDKMYQAMFGHAPDAAGKQFYIDGFNNGTFSAAGIGYSILVGAQNADAVSILNKTNASNQFSSIVDGRPLDSPLFGTGTSFNATYAGDADAVAARTGLVAVTSLPTSIPSPAQTTSFIQTNIANPGDPILSATGGQTFTLTIGATDVITGTGGNDTIIGQLGQSTTLQASDNVNGAGGTDTFRVVSDGAAAQSSAGFTVTNTEILEVQAQAGPGAAGGTTLGLENVTGLTTIRESSSTADLTLNNVNNIVDLQLNSALGAPNLTVNYVGGAVAGAADVQKLALNGNAMGTLAVAGIETLAATTATASSSVVGLVGAALKTVTVAGDKSLSITTALPASVTSVDASAQTAGGTSVILTNAANVAVKGGAGSDSATFTGALTSSDSYDGGEGRDTIVANLAEYTGTSYAVASKITKVETLRIADQLTGAFDASKFTGDDTVILALGYANGSSVIGMETAYTLNIRGGATNAGSTLTAAITNATSPTTNDTLNLSVGAPTSVAATDGATDGGTVSTTGIENLTLLSNGTLATGTNAVILADTTATTSSVATLVITGANGIKVTSSNVGTGSMTSVDASAATGNVNMTGLAPSLKAAGAVIKGGAGADSITGGAGAGGDTIDAGAGADTVNGTVGADGITLGAGADTMVYTNANQSTTNSGVDTITDFTSGADVFNLTGVLGAQPGAWKGNQATFSAAQNAMVAGDAVVDVVYQLDEKILWIDTNDDGLLNAADFRISLPNTAALTAADVGLTATGATITLTAAAAAVSTGAPTNATGSTTVYGDTINSTFAFLSNSTVNGAAGTDTLNVSDAITTAWNFQTAGAGTGTGLTLVEVVNLGGGSTAAVTASTPVTATTATAANQNQAIVNTSGAAASTVILPDVADGAAGVGVKNQQSFSSTGTGVDTVTLGKTAGLTYSQSASLGGGADILTIGGTHLGTLNGGDGADTLTNGAVVSDIKGATVSNFETMTLGAAMTMTTAQNAGFTTAVNGAGFNVTFSDAGAAADLAASTANTYTLASGGSFTGNAAAVAYVITGAAGNETVTISAGWTTADSFDGLAGTSDKFILSQAVVGAIDLAGTATTLVNVEQFQSTKDQAGGAITLDTGLNTVDLSAQTTALALTATGVNFTSLKLGASNDTVNVVTTGAATATIDMGVGTDTITSLVRGAGTAAATITFGAGNDTITDIAANVGTGNFTFKFATPAAQQLLTIAATTGNLLVGDILDFGTAATAVVPGVANGVTGVAAPVGVGQLFVDTTGGNTTFTFDADGSRTFSVGDVQIIITGNVISGTIDVNGNFLVGSSA